MIINQSGNFELSKEEMELLVHVFWAAENEGLIRDSEEDKRIEQLIREIQICL